MRTKTLAALWIGLWMALPGGAWGQQDDDPWARFRAYRQQLQAAAQEDGGRAVERVRGEILNRETALGVLVTLPGVDPAGGDLYFKKAISLVESEDPSADPAEALAGRIDIYQRYSSFLGNAGRYSEAEEWLERSLREVEQRVGNWSSLPTGDTRREAVAALTTQWADLLRDAASVASHTGKGERGLRYLDRAEELAPLGDDREAAFPVLKSRARLLEAVGRREDALEVFTRASAVRLDPELWPSIQSLSRALGTPVDQPLAKARELRLAAAVDFPEIRLQTAMDGQDVTFDKVKGRVTLFNVFFPTCGFCNAEMPHLKKIRDEYADQGLSLVSVNLLPDQNELIADWKKKGGYEHPILVTETTDYLVKTLGLRFPGGMPANFLVDAGGKVHFRHIGYQPGEEEILEAQVRELLGLAPFVASTSG